MTKVTSREPVVFLAPGAGLGHIVRVSALAYYLEEKNIPCRVVTTSRWAGVLEQITGIATTYFPIKKWGSCISAYLGKTPSSLIVQDSFPFGFNTENLEPLAAKRPFVYLARYLKVGAYFKAINKNWDRLSPLVSNIIEIEPLSAIHTHLIHHSPVNHYTLNSRIRFPSESMKQTVPAELKAKLSSKRLHLIVHSGPQHETEKLISIAMENINKDSQGELAILSPVFVEKQINNSYDYFPAAALFPEAYRIYTGGGYNSIAEAAFYRDRLTAIPFPRNYDDQKARIDNLTNSKKAVYTRQSGAIQAAEIIISLL